MLNNLNAYINRFHSYFNLHYEKINFLISIFFILFIPFSFIIYCNKLFTIFYIYIYTVGTISILLYVISIIYSKIMIIKYPLRYINISLFYKNISRMFLIISSIFIFILTPFIIFSIFISFFFIQFIMTLFISLSGLFLLAEIIVFTDPVFIFFNFFLKIFKRKIIFDVFKGNNLWARAYLISFINNINKKSDFKNTKMYLKFFFNNINQLLNNKYKLSYKNDKNIYEFIMLKIYYEDIKEINKITKKLEQISTELLDEKNIFSIISMLEKIVNNNVHKKPEDNYIFIENKIYIYIKNNIDKIITIILTIISIIISILIK